MFKFDSAVTAKVCEINTTNNDWEFFKNQLSSQHFYQIVSPECWLLKSNKQTNINYSHLLSVKKQVVIDFWCPFRNNISPDKFLAIKKHNRTDLFISEMTKKFPKSRFLHMVLPGGNIWDWEKQTKSYLDVDFHVKGLRLALAVADVEAEDVSRSLSFGLAALDVEDALRRQVVHGEGRVRADHPRAADRAPLRTEGDESNPLQCDLRSMIFPSLLLL